MMKKRLLALALCLVMMTSLLPITAAAEDYDFGSVFVGLENGGVYCEDVQFELHLENYPAELSGFAAFKVSPDSGSGGMVMTSDGDGKYTLHVSAGEEYPYISFMIMRKDAQEMDALHITLKNGHNWSAWTSNGDGTHSRTCGNGCVDSPQTASCADTSPADCKCDDCGASMHTWQFKAAGNTLTGSCGGANCDIGQIVLTLKADSVTLPNSPFNARLEGWENFKKAVPSATYNPNSFDYKLNGEPVTDKSNPKAGNYQAGILISNLPGTVEYEGVAERANTNSAYLFTQYTAVDPAVTAQTGDNRPIEIMVASVVVFSALAAAAFIVDSKRRSQQ